MLSLAFDAVSKRFPDGTVALDGVSVKIEPGDGVVLLGHNGSGKSTMLRCAVGLEKATSGRVLVGGVDTTAARGRILREVRTKVGFVFQGYGLVGNLSVFHNVLHGSLGRSRGPLGWLPATAPGDERRRAMECLERVDLEDFAHRRAGSLSGGQQQKLALARMLMQDPEVVLADEPVANLDPKAGRKMLGLLWELARERGLTVVCALHQLELAWEYADRIVALRGGRLALDGRKDSMDQSALQGLYPGEHRARQPSEDQA